MDEAVTEARGRAQVSAYRVCGRQNGTGTGFSSSSSGFPLSISIFCLT
jgi:hypothetical protein